MPTDHAFRPVPPSLRCNPSMDFTGTLSTIAAFLDEQDARYALIGALALSAYGSARATLDLDLVVDRDAQENLIEFMESLGFETLYRSVGYSNHLHPDPDRGRVDFVYVQGSTANKLFGAATAFVGPGDLSIPIPTPEHLAAMKVLAMKNDPSRTYQDLADIRTLMQQPGVDREEIGRQFERHGMMERFREIEESLE